MPRSPSRSARPRPFLFLSVSSALLLAGLLASGCAPKGGGRGGFQMPPMPVEIAEVRPHTVRETFRALGSLEAEENIQVVAEIGGVVRELPMREGQPVAAGALLARIDDREIAAEAERTAALRDRARSGFERAKKLHDQQLLSQSELDDAQASLRVAEADAALAHARLDKTRIRAPFAGMVGRRLISSGAYLKVGDPVTDLARYDRLRLTFSAPERYTGQLKHGAGVDLHVTAWPSETFHGEITVVDPQVDPATRTVQLVAVVPNRERRLRPGMSAEVAATLSVRQQALTVPDEAVFAEADQSFVFMVKPDNSVTRTAVTLGARDSSSVEITHGLKAGDRVVQAGHQKLFEGAKVVPMDSAAPGAGAPGTAAKGT